MSKLKFLGLIVGLTLVVGTAFFTVSSHSFGLRPEAITYQMQSISNLKSREASIKEDEVDEVAVPKLIDEEISSDLVDLDVVVKEPAPEHAIKVLKVPFTSQAPFANWSMPYQEACEEASILMLVEYLEGNNRMIIPPDEADNMIVELVDWETQHGYSMDITAAEVVRVLAERYQIQARVLPYDAEVIKQELRAKRPVIIPAAGQLLGNPYFTPPGPLYHMLIIKGYEGDEFIVNDPGTKRGESYRYEASVLEYAAHDWNNGQVEEGDKVMVVIN